ncbi:MAG: hypothetical protein QOJ32_2263 [Frankiaceae bacterium]|jgi:uncharacterized membrane protein (DUF2068 family)|nr:hypothetical protein [Frankiaceae bacterium]
MFSRELRVCGRAGHITYSPDEPHLAERLRADTGQGEAWRCLRCGDWVVGSPRGRGPADEAPVPARGKALRQLTILRILAVERVVRALVLIAAAYGIHRFASAQRSLQDSFGRLLPAARPLATRLGLDLDHSSILREAEKALHARHGTLTLLAVGLLLYGLLELVEGVGLWLARRWAEYLTVVATAAFLPLEIHEMLKTVTVTKVGAFVINVLAVVYLVLAKRLFGARGGRKAYEHELGGESLLAVEEAAGTGDDAPSGRSVGMTGAGTDEGERPMAHR